MRISPLALSLLAGCGPVRLGEAPFVEANFVDAGELSGLDASVEPVPRVAVALKVEGDCDKCVELAASAAEGVPPYTFEWDDGSELPRRRVCTPILQDAFSVTVIDAHGARSETRSTRLALPLANCPVDAGVPALCLQNPSFEGTPGYNTALPVMFDAKPWSDCTIPSRANTPDIANETVAQQQTWVDVPKATDGKTWLGLFEGEQASQALCASLRAGDERYITFDAMRIDITGGTGGLAEAASLQIFGGTSANCSPLEILWGSPKLTTTWQRFCAALAPRQFMDLLTLKSISDGSLPSDIYVAVDNIRSVDSCP